MLTVNADDHALMQNYHRPSDEKRMVVILPLGLCSDWLDAPAERSMEFMRQFPADRLVATGEPRSGWNTLRTGWSDSTCRRRWPAKPEVGGIEGCAPSRTSSNP